MRRPMTVRLAAPGGEGLRAAFDPDLNMVLHSLTLGGRELLATRNGLDAYAQRGSTMGVPLLHPWANRLEGHAYTAAGRSVELARGSALFKSDAGGLPIHGAMPALCRWELLELDEGSGSLTARLDWGRGHAAFELFPFPHRLDYRARVSARSVEIALRLEPTEDEPVPVSFGFHPYLRIQGERASARMSLPVGRRLVLDQALIPTGATEPCEAGTRELGETAWDDGFSELVEPIHFLLSAGDGEIALMFLRGYRFAQVFAPPGSDFVCFEPMTAPANALAAGGPDLPLVEPGGRYETAFAIAVR